jgi:nucleotidyltransferase substrate binding protein (TIGR01987 family)
MRKIQDSLDNLGRAIDRLKEALNEPATNVLVVDGTIQRFEFVFELLWKTMKRALEYEGITVATPRETLKQAYSAGWLQDETAWLAMLDSRNTTSHVYLHEEIAEEHYEEIKNNFPELERTYQFLLKRYGNNTPD